VTLFRKRNGTFVRITSKAAAVTDRGAFASSFRRPRSGTCKATAQYRGDATHLPSRASATFRC
jgi:hypothetical protein